jgi:hypothetical protein
LNRCVILVDNSNLFIGGKQLAAERKGARRRGRGDAPSDPSWRLDFDALHTCLADGRQVHVAVMVGSHPPESESPWEESARGAGFELLVQETNPRNKEKAVDTALAVRGTEIICAATEPMVLVLAAGDRDYVPLVEVAQRHGWEVELCAFQSSYGAHGELAEMVTRVRPLDDCFDQLSRYEFEWLPRGRHAGKRQGRGSPATAATAAGN